ncbi:hypothetical protein [Arthrobacter sp. MYb213]|uniref:hypothetical protein n=1 Tax=Arthrobacter sp. MYb213 TaxID=1848595 RepID=UPI000CFBA6F2|nr:hypothetical protein [Arthrobacter sp. MYb213]PRB68778.1 hypothetical protein CQ011_13690 [Arthrobacter sp. MYb213]
MPKYPFSLVIPVILAVSLTSCASTPEIDWEQAQNEANKFNEAAMAAKGSLGGGSLRVGQGTPASDESGIVLTYASGARMTGLSVSCFGEGIIHFGFTTQSGSNWRDSDSVDLFCDGEDNVVPVSEALSRVEVDAVQFNGVLSEGSGGVLAVAVSGVAS